MEATKAEPIKNLLRPGYILTRGDYWAAAIYISCAFGLVLTFYYQEELRRMDDMNKDEPSIFDKVINIPFMIFHHIFILIKS